MGGCNNVHGPRKFSWAVENHPNYWYTQVPARTPVHALHTSSCKNRPSTLSKPFRNRSKHALHTSSCKNSCRPAPGGAPPACRPAVADTQSRFTVYVTGLLPEAQKRIFRVWGRHGGLILVLRATHSASGCVTWPCALPPARIGNQRTSAHLHYVNCGSQPLPARLRTVVYYLNILSILLDTNAQRVFT